MSVVRTAKGRVLEALRAAGARGCTTAELCQPAVGGERFGARVHELRGEGYEIVERRVRAGSSLYVLGQLAAPTAPTADASGIVERDGHWTRRWMCPSCAYRHVTGPTCSRGHAATLGWHLDQRDLWAAEAKEAA